MLLGFLVTQRVFHILVHCVSVIVGRSTRVLVRASQVFLRAVISRLSYLHGEHPLSVR